MYTLQTLNMLLHASTFKVTWISDKIDECEAVSLCGLVVRALDWQLRGVGFNPHGGLK